jgi:hypothetical protein
MSSCGNGGIPAKVAALQLNAMRLRRFPSLLLSALIQLAPLLRVATAEAATAVAPVIAVLRWAVGAMAVAGSFHAVSGASGITITQGASTITTPRGTNSTPMGFRVQISSTVQGIAQSYTATGLPPGMNCSVQGVISGIPSHSGGYTAQITGWKTSPPGSDSDVANRYFFTANVPIVIVDRPPQITSQPQSVTVNAGGNASFTVVATGDALRYRWLKNDIEVSLSTPGATNATLTLNAVTAAKAGDYKVRILNTGGAIFSDVAVLTVNAAVIPPVLSGELLPEGRFRVRLTGRAGVTYSLQGSFDYVGWTEVLAGDPGAGTLEYTTPDPVIGPLQIFRAVAP